MWRMVAVEIQEKDAGERRVFFIMEREGGCQVLHVGVSLWGEREIKVMHGESWREREALEEEERNGERKGRNEG